MKSLFSFLAFACFFLQSKNTYSQQQRFNLVAADENQNWGTIADIKQDPQGYIWLSTQLKGLQRYDGSHFISYINDPRNTNSLANNRVPSIYIDSTGIVWAATYGGGLDRFDPLQNSFTHFRHNPKDEGSLLNDTVFVVERDHLGNLWIGTYGGLEMFNEKTAKFIQYKNIPGDSSSLSYNRVWDIYEDRQGTLWVGCGSPFLNLGGEKFEDGGLNRFNRSTGKFIHYLHDPKDSNSITNNKVRAMLEDSKGNFWVGSIGDGLQTMDRRTGKFTHYYYDPAHPDKLSRPPVRTQAYAMDFISFIKEDFEGSIWIGSWINGMNKYDPVTKKITHFGLDIKDNKIVSAKDTTSGFHDFSSWRALSSKDGMLWFTTSMGNLYNINFEKKRTIPYYPINQPEANSFYYEADKNILWIGTLKGLVRKDLNNQAEKSWMHDPNNANSLSNDSIFCLRGDGQGNLWIATANGFCKFNTSNEVFTIFRHNEKNAASISGDYVYTIFIDHNKDIYLACAGHGIDKLNPATGAFAHYTHEDRNPNSLSFNEVSSFSEDKNNDLWVGTFGVDRLDGKSGKFYHYLQNTAVIALFVDATNNLWVGSNNSLYHYDRELDQFIPFIDPNTHTGIEGILHILEDNNKNLWISTNNAIVKINDKRDEVKWYGEDYGVHKNIFSGADNFKGKNGELFLGDQNGYYAFFPETLKNNVTGSLVNFTSFKINDREIIASPAGILKKPLWQTEQIGLNYDQNTFSFDFYAVDFLSPGEKKYLFMLENYDNDWHYTGTDHKAYLFNVPPGKYVFKVKAVNNDGSWSEKAIAIIISPPWWRTWWAYALFTILIIAIIWGFIAYRSRNLRNTNKLLEEKVVSRTQELQQQKEKVESTLSELKSTQAQLIQSEKMASLGELTAGIAHEIQNPLNFVNNFSEVNKELVDELQSELKAGNVEEAIAISTDIKDNEEKINHHGKRADAIVKGMLQHSRSSTGVKEPTNINILADEYLRLAYHGLRAKDKEFSATMKTDFDENFGKINIVPQDIGRVLLNLYNNAFYAVNEKAKNPYPLKGQQEYEPIVSVITKYVKSPSGGLGVELTVKDNGNGIPQKIIDKIFQPFFTTKPTGQGTGLGLSLSYDIIKAHGGEIKVETMEDDGSKFIIQLPLN